MENKFILFIMSVVSIIAIILAITAFVRVQQFEDETPTPVSATPTAVAVAATNTPSPSPTTTSIPSPTNTLTPLPTTKPTNTATDTPTSSPTHTPTVTDTSTVTSTPTEEPLPTNTPPPTVAPTDTPVPPPPAPSAEAVVIAPEGFVRLYSGPAMEGYDRIATLPNGTNLDVLRRVYGKDDWIKVAANPGTAEAIEGYVNIVSGLIGINVSLDEFPAIYEYGPKLVQPRRFETYGIDALIEFTWEPAGFPLDKDQFYSVILVRDDLTDEDACYHWQTKDIKLSFTPKDFGCTAGDYHWGVGLATIMGHDEEDKIIWRDDSERDERNPIGIGVPHSGKPSGSEGGGGGGGLRNDPNRPSN